MNPEILGLIMQIGQYLARKRTPPRAPVRTPPSTAVAFSGASEPSMGSADWRHSGPAWFDDPDTLKQMFPDSPQMWDPRNWSSGTAPARIL